ncbi:CCC1, partial [Symbiodinium sp. KB8]
FSLVLYSSFFLLWGSVASDKYLKGDFLGHESHHGRRLSSAGISPEASRHIVQTVVWNPFPNSAFIGGLEFKVTGGLHSGHPNRASWDFQTHVIFKDSE